MGEKSTSFDENSLKEDPFSAVPLPCVLDDLKDDNSIPRSSSMPSLVNPQYQESKGDSAERSQKVFLKVNGPLGIINICR
jgi:hypothetical protein